MDKLIHDNKDGKYLFVYSHEFKEAINFALENKLEQIQIRGVIGKENINTIADFSEIKKLSPYLKKLSFGDLVDNTIINFESIYSLLKLEKININCKQNFIIDVSLFSNLKNFGTEYWKGLKNMDKINSLESMVITKYPNENITEFIGLENLKIFHIYSSKIKTLEGINRLNNLEELVLAYNKKLENINDIKNLKRLKVLRIYKCKSILNLEFIKDLKNMKNLYIE